MATLPVTLCILWVHVSEHREMNRDGKDHVLQNSSLGVGVGGGEWDQERMYRGL